MIDALAREEEKRGARGLILLEEGDGDGAPLRSQKKGVAGAGRGDRIGAAEPAGPAQGDVPAFKGAD